MTSPPTAVPAISECLWRAEILIELRDAARTAVPAISECLWRGKGATEDEALTDRSPRDFRVLVADGLADALKAVEEPQSPRFQSACGGAKSPEPSSKSPNRSPRDFRVLVAGRTPFRPACLPRTAVPAISECLWRIQNSRIETAA